MDGRVCTELVTGWALSSPVLVKWLAEMVRDEIAYGVEELPPAVADLLDPGRDFHALAFLRAVGAPVADADAVYARLGGDWRWLDRTDWDGVRKALLEAHSRDCGVLCPDPHPPCEFDSLD